MVRFLRTKYQDVKIVFITHHSEVSVSKNLSRLEYFLLGRRTNQVFGEIIIKHSGNCKVILLIHVTKRDFYRQRISKLFSTGLVRRPSDVSRLKFQFVREKGEVIGWRLIDERLELRANGDTVTANLETMILDRTRQCFVNHEFSYHYEPGEKSLNHCFRIELDRDGLHANPDSTFLPALKHQMRKDDLTLKIDDFNLLYFLLVVLAYQKGKGYPLLSDVGRELNDVIDRFRRRVQSA